MKTSKWVRGSGSEETVDWEEGEEEGLEGVDWEEAGMEGRRL